MKNFRKISLISAVTSMSFFMWACTAPQAPALQNISIDKTELSLVAGETAVITAEAVPAEAEAVFEWSTSDGDIATVSDGTVTAIETGEAVITAEAGGFKAECRITVVGIPVETITLNETVIELNKGETFKLEAEVSPENADYESLSWASSDEDVVLSMKAHNPAVHKLEISITRTVPGRRSLTIPRLS